MDAETQIAMEHMMVDHQDKCIASLAKVFVPWDWLVGILATLIFVVGGVAYYISSTSAKTQAAAIQVYEQQTQIVKSINDLASEIRNKK